VSDSEDAQIVIIGGGPAGYTAAIYAARAALNPVCIEGYASGGQIIRSEEVHNFPGYPGGITGTELADRMREQAVSFGAVIRTDEVASADLSGSPFEVVTSERVYRAQAVIVATGAQSRRLGLPSEDEYDGRGVCYCAICDGPLFAGQRVAVVGGGDAAVEEALALSRIASHVTLIHRRAQFKATATLLTAIASTQIEVLTPYVVTEIFGGDLGVSGIRVRDVGSGGTRDIEVDGCFVAIGHVPASGQFEGHLKRDPQGFLWTEPHTTETSVPGVFAAGDVADPRYRQAITAAASGCAAAIDAERWLLGRHTDIAPPGRATTGAGLSGTQPAAELVMPSLRA
jgi:thioredoxin-disulfide reductase